MVHMFIYFLLMLLENFSWNLAYLVEPYLQSRDFGIYPGQNHTLICEFRNAVDCIWYKNDVPIDVTNRYRYISNHGRNTTLCSLEIEPYIDEDKGRWRCLGNISRFEESVLSTLSNAVLPNRTVIVFNGEPVTEKVVTLRIPKNIPVPCNACLICIAEKANPAVILHWELNGIPFVEKSRLSVSLTDGGYYTTKLFFDRDLRQIAHSSNLSCIAQQGNHTLSTSIFVEWQKPCEWNMPTLRIISIAVGSGFLAFTLVALCACIYACSKKQDSTSSQLGCRHYSLDDWTTNLSTKALLPEPPIISYDPNELKVPKINS